MTHSLKQRWLEVRAGIETACKDLQRAAPHLIAVSKRHSEESIRACYHLGQRDFGENYAQELARKAEALSDLEDIRWHMIGPLQRNKAKLIAPFSPVVHTINSVRLIHELEKRATRPFEAMIQVNLAEEAQKSGVAPDEIGELLQAAHDCERIQISGLMLIPPREGDAQTWFRSLRALAKEHSLEALSMGMSADYTVALAEGATHIRVGTAIFGPRPNDSRG